MGGRVCVCSTDFLMITGATHDVTEDYRAVLAVLPFPLTISGTGLGSENRLIVCVLQGLDAIRAMHETRFDALSHDTLLRETFVQPQQSRPSSAVGRKGGDDPVGDVDGLSPAFKARGLPEENTTDPPPRHHGLGKGLDAPPQPYAVDQYFPHRRQYRVRFLEDIDWDAGLLLGQ